MANIRGNRILTILAEMDSTVRQVPHVQGRLWALEDMADNLPPYTESVSRAT